MIYAKHPRLHEIYESYAFNGESFAKFPEKYYIFPYENELNGLLYFCIYFLWNNPDFAWKTKYLPEVIGLKN